METRSTHPSARMETPSPPSGVTCGRSHAGVGQSSPGGTAPEAGPQRSLGGGR